MASEHLKSWITKWRRVQQALNTRRNDMRWELRSAADGMGGHVSRIVRERQELEERRPN